MKDDNKKLELDVITPLILEENPNKFQKRALEFWNEIDGIVDLLNEMDPKRNHTTIESPQVNLFLMWRLLNEIKDLKIQQKLLKKEIEKNGTDIRWK